MPLILEGSFAHLRNTNATSIGFEDQFGIYILALPLTGYMSLETHLNSLGSLFNYSWLNGLACFHITVPQDFLSQFP